MKLWASKHPYGCLTPMPINETPTVNIRQRVGGEHPMASTANLRHGVGDSSWAFPTWCRTPRRSWAIWVYDSHIGASILTASYNYPTYALYLRLVYIDIGSYWVTPNFGAMRSANSEIEKRVRTFACAYVGIPPTICSYVAKQSLIHTKFQNIRSSHS